MKTQEKKENNYSNSKTILIVDDDKITLDLLNIILKQKDYNTLLAKNGQEAIDIHKKRNDISLILMDIQMPILNGFEAVSEIRKYELETKTQIPIIAITAYALKEYKEKCLQVGCNDYIIKPIMVPEILESIKKYI